MFDPLYNIFTKIINKYLPDEYKGSQSIVLLTELRKVAYAVIRGNTTIEEAKDYLKDFFDTFFGDDLDEDIKNKLIDEVIKAIRVENTRIKFYIPRRGFSTSPI